MTAGGECFPGPHVAFTTANILLFGGSLTGQRQIVAEIFAHLPKK